MIIYFNKTKKEFSNQYFENSSLILTFYLIYLTTLYIRLYLSSSFFLNLPAVNRPTIEVKIAVALVANGATSAVFGTFFVDVFAEVTFFPDEMPEFPLSAFTAAFVFLPSLRSSTVVAVTFLVEESPPVMPAFFL